MTLQELSNIAQQASSEVLAKNRDTIAARIMGHFGEGETKYTIEEFSAVMLQASIDVAADISAAVAAKLLVELGLVEVE